MSMVASRYAMQYNARMTRKKFADREAGELAWRPLPKPEPLNLTRAVIDGHLDHPLSDNEWNLLDTQGFIAQVKEGKRTAAQLAVTVEQWREAVAGPKPRIRSHSVPPTLRAEAVAELVAVEARKMEPVIEFRRHVLRGKLLAADQLDRWFEFLSRRQEVKPWVKVYVSPEELEMAVAPIGPSNIVNHGYDTLEYFVPGADRVHRVLVASKGVLGWLKWLSVRLAQRFLWKEAHATTFILTGLTPPIRECEYRVEDWRAAPALTRVVFEIDPTMSPREVANLYRQIRFRHFGRRHRSMTAKHIELAKFWSSIPEGRTWKALREEWNKLHPRWAYKREQNFARDCEQARKRLLGEGAGQPAGVRFGPPLWGPEVPPTLGAE
jgi:hypothetical protein